MTFTEKRKPTYAYTLGARHPKFHLKDISDYAFFHMTFMGFSFYCLDTNKVLSKSQVFWRNPKAAFGMAKSLYVTNNYRLVEYSTHIPVKNVA